MDLGLDGKKVLITGASSGLGRYTAESFVKEGASVFLAARNEEILKKTVIELNQIKKGNYYEPIDFMKEECEERLFKSIDACFENIDIIVHALGGTLEIKDPLSAPEDYLKVWKLNLGISIEINNRFIPSMAEKRFGRIVHVSSSSSVMADASVAYSSAKAALNIYVKGLARKFAQFNVLINAILPGPFRCEGNHWDDIYKNNPERYEDFVNKKMSMKALCNVKDIGDLTVFTCSERANSTVGSAISVDGGII